MQSSQPDLSLVYDGLKVTGNPLIDYYDLARDKGLMGPQDTSFDEHHLELLAYYRKAFEQYMLVTLRLDTIDQGIEESGLGFAPWWDEKMTLYAMSTYDQDTMLSLRHLFLRSPIHLERLSTDDLATLEALYAENGSTVTQEALDFVARTYPELIRVFVFGRPVKEGIYVSLGPGGGACADPDSLVIAFTDDDHNEGDDESDDWQARYSYLKECLPSLQEELSKKLSVPVTLIIIERGGISYVVDDKGICDPYAK